MMHRLNAFILFLFILFCFTAVLAEETKTEVLPLKQGQTEEQHEKVESKAETSLKMLHSLIELEKNLSQRIKEKNKILEKSSSDAEKELLKTELEKLDKQLNDSVVDFERIATGIVTSLSHEMVELVQRGGSRKIYQTSDFLAQSPLNISVNFRLKIPFGISYNLQKDSTGSVLEILKTHIKEQIEKEGYKQNLLNLNVEFAQAGASSLDIVVIADFKGDLASLYQRLSRAIQRWCVDACTLNNWEIPFPQLTIHQ